MAASNQISQRAFFGISALLFTTSAAVTIVWFLSMSAMGDIPMPGGWTMSMAWIPMSGPTLLGTAAKFLGMWFMMIVTMMLPSGAAKPVALSPRRGRTGETRLGRLTALVGAGTSLCGPRLAWPSFR